MTGWIAAFVLAAAQDALPPRIEVAERGGAVRERFPVHGTVPLPRGALREEELPRLVLRDGAGAAVPLQARPVSRWLDGSVQWLLLDFPSTQDATSKRSYALARADAAPASPPPLAREGAGGIEIDTGPLRARLAPGVCRIEVRDGAAWRTAVDGGLESRAELRERATGEVREHVLPLAGGVLEENGPLRAVVRIEGWHEARGGARFSPSVVRLTFLRDQAFVRVSHTFVMSRDPETCTIPRLAVELRLPKAADEAAFSSGAGPALRLPLSTSRVAVLQEDTARPSWPPRDEFFPRFRIFNGARVAAEGTKYPGALVLRGPETAVGVHLARMWRMHPKALIYNPPSRTLSVELWPGEIVGELDLRRAEKRGLDHYRDFAARDPLFNDPKYSPEHYVAHTVEHSAMGVSRTHDLVLDFGPAKDPDLLAALHEEPLLPFAGAEWNVRSGVLGKQVLPGAYRKDLEDVPARLVELLLSEVERRGWYGAFAYGNARYTFDKNAEDWMHYHPKYAWYNAGHAENGGTLLGALWIQYLRTGDPRIREFAEAHGRQRRDVSTVHFHEKDQVGSMIRHGGFDPWAGNRHKAGAHAPLNGLLLDLQATGDPRSRDVFLLAGRAHESVKNLDWGRNLDTDLDSMALLYRFTRDERHYARCIEILDHFDRNLDPFAKDIGQYSYFSYWHSAFLTLHGVLEEKGDRAALEKLRRVFLGVLDAGRHGSSVPSRVEAYLALAWELDPSPARAGRLLASLDRFALVARGRPGWGDGLLATHMNDFGYLPAVHYGLHAAERIEGAAPPAVRPDGGTFAGAVEVALEADPAVSEVRYTLDGTEPTANSPRYGKPFRLERDTVVAARSFRDGKPSPRSARAAFRFEKGAIARDGLRLWLRADAGVEAEGGVAAWRDQSGEGRHAVQPRPEARPGLEPGRAVVGRQGACLQVPGLGLRDCTVVFAGRPAGGALLSDGDDGHVGGDGVRWSTAEHGVNVRGGGSGGASVWTVVRRGPSVEFYRDGVRSGGGQPRRTGLAGGGPTVFDLSLLLAQRPGRDPFLGELSELAVYDRALDPPEREAVERALAGRRPSK